MTTTQDKPGAPHSPPRHVWVRALGALDMAVALAVVALLLGRLVAGWRVPSDALVRQWDRGLLAYFAASAVARVLLTGSKLEWLRGRWFDLVIVIPLLELTVGGLAAPWYLVRQVAALIGAFAKTKRAERLVSQLRLHPARLMVGSFAFAIAIGTVLLSLPLASATGESIRAIDALFTSTSATCVTGLIVLDTGSDFSLFGQLVILVLLQLGGLGIMTFSVSLVLAVGGTISKSREVVMRDMLDQESVQDVLALVRFILVVTFVAEAGGALVLFFCFGAHSGYSPRTLYEAVFHSVSAFCNAGFSVFRTSLEAFRADVWVNGVMSALIIVGGLGFPVLRDLLMMGAGRRLGAGLSPRLRTQTKVVLTATAVLLVGGTAFFYVVDAGDTLRGLPTGERLLASWFQSVTARTAGFNTVRIGAVGHAGLLVLICLMFVGASPGSTGGGVKTTTAALLWQAMRAAFRGRREVELFQRTVPRELVRRAVALVVLSVLVLAVTTIALMTVEDQPFEAIAFEATSAFGTVGLSTGATPNLTDAGRLIVTVLMFVGRLGPLTLALSLVGDVRPAAYRYPDERLMVG